MFTTREVQETVANLKSADLATYKVGQKSNLLLNYVRNELIKRAFAVDAGLATPVEINVNMTVMSYIAPSLALLSKDGQYPALFEKSFAEFKNGDIKFVYQINGAGLSDEYRGKLNSALGINLPALSTIANEVV